MLEPGIHILETKPTIPSLRVRSSQIEFCGLSVARISNTGIHPWFGASLWLDRQAGLSPIRSWPPPAWGRRAVFRLLFFREVRVCRDHRRDVFRFLRLFLNDCWSISLMFGFTFSRTWHAGALDVRLRSNNGRGEVPHVTSMTSACSR